LLLFSLEPLPDGSFGALDRLPRAVLLDEARAARDAHGTELLACFGGNGRSQGFSAMVYTFHHKCNTCAADLIVKTTYPQFCLFKTHSLI
jgi:hypothetical protein